MGIIQASGKGLQSFPHFLPGLRTRIVPGLQHTGMGFSIHLPLPAFSPQPPPDAWGSPPAAHVSGIYSSVMQIVVQGLAALASPGSLLEMQIHGPRPKR